VTVTSEYLGQAAACSAATLRPALTRDDWSRRAGELDASCLDTVDHLVSGLLFYANQLANRAHERLPRLRDFDTGAPVEELVVLVPAAAAVLGAVARASGPGARAYHPAGMADAEGFLAMGCDELLVHTGDVAAGLGLSFAPPDELCAAVLARLFPWAPRETPPWPTLLWANGRAPLGDQARLDADWYWHCAPLEEWDGSVARRTNAPSWRP
jgi:hypothetical protein